MVQREVADRFDYNLTKKSNRLNLLSYLLSDFKKEFHVSNNVFYPKPKVASCVISFKPNIKNVINPIKFGNFTKLLFFTKRKKIINNIIRDSNYKKIIEKRRIIDINLSKRPEDLNFNEVIKLFSILN